MDQSYDVNSVMQKHWGAMLSEFMWNALASCTHHSSVAIADIGASTGLNSCKSLKPHLERFRGISEAPVLLYHTDRPENHWNALFTNLTGSPDSYQSVPNVYSFAVGKSRTSRLTPSISLTPVLRSTGCPVLPREEMCSTLPKSTLKSCTP